MCQHIGLALRWPSSGLESTGRRRIPHQKVVPHKAPLLSPHRIGPFARAAWQIRCIAPFSVAHDWPLEQREALVTGRLELDRPCASSPQQLWASGDALRSLRCAEIESALCCCSACRAAARTLQTVRPPHLRGARREQPTGGREAVSTRAQRGSSLFRRQSRRMGLDFDSGH